MRDLPCYWSGIGYLLLNNFGAAKKNRAARAGNPASSLKPVDFHPITQWVFLINSIIIELNDLSSLFLTDLNFF
jgi:hypothetical protein